MEKSSHIFSNKGALAFRKVSSTDYSFPPQYSTMYVCIYMCVHIYMIHLFSDILRTNSQKVDERNRERERESSSHESLTRQLPVTQYWANRGNAFNNKTLEKTIHLYNVKPKAIIIIIIINNIITFK